MSNQEEVISKFRLSALSILRAFIRSWYLLAAATTFSVKIAVISNWVLINIPAPVFRFLGLGKKSEVFDVIYAIEAIIWLGAMIPTILAVKKWIFTQYTLTDRSLYEDTGMLSRHREKIDLRTIEDDFIVTPFYYRPAKITVITLISDDKTCPRIDIDGAPVDAYNAICDQVFTSSKRRLHVH